MCAYRQPPHSGSPALPAIRRGRLDVHRGRIDDALPHALDSRAHPFAGNDARHQHDKPVRARNHSAAGGRLVDRERHHVANREHGDHNHRRDRRARRGRVGSACFARSAVAPVSNTRSSAGRAVREPVDRMRLPGPARTLRRSWPSESPTAPPRPRGPGRRARRFVQSGPRCLEQLDGRGPPAARRAPVASRPARPRPRSRARRDAVEQIVEPGAEGARRLRRSQTPQHALHVRRQRRPATDASRRRRLPRPSATPVARRHSSNVSRTSASQKSIRTGRRRGPLA